MLLADLTGYLATQSIGVVGTTLFYGILPPDPDVLVTLYEYGGKPIEPDLGTGNVRLEYPLIQALARGIKDDYDGPRLAMQKVLKAFTVISNQTINGIVYKAVLANGSPFPLRRDDNFRIEVVCNFQVTKDYSAS